MGRLDKDNMYSLLAESFLVISIPSSDSSPRSVYESIFLGCCIAATYNPWMDKIPDCMRKRIYLVDLDNENWFKEAYSHAEKLKAETYIPSEEALEMFDQERSMQKAIEILY